VAARKFGMLQPINTTNFIPKVNDESCTGCGRCVKACPIGAIELAKSDNDPNSKRMMAEVNRDICLGCGVCVRSCSSRSIILEQREQRVITPVNSVHRIAMMAIEKGQLHQLIFDNQALQSHRAMAAILSVILKLPPIKQAMASKQMKSVYLDRLISRFGK
jgi:NAD-dependent dihydropyrimidine dehydrogenase PreA subunit